MHTLLYFKSKFCLEILLRNETGYYNITMPALKNKLLGSSTSGKYIFVIFFVEY